MCTVIQVAAAMPFTTRLDMPVSKVEFRSPLRAVPIEIYLYYYMMGKMFVFEKLKNWRLELKVYSKVRYYDH